MRSYAFTPAALEKILSAQNEPTEQDINDLSYSLFQPLIRLDDSNTAKEDTLIVTEHGLSIVNTTLAALKARSINTIKAILAKSKSYRATLISHEFYFRLAHFSKQPADIEQFLKVAGERADHPGLCGKTSDLYLDKELLAIEPLVLKYNNLRETWYHTYINIIDKVNFRETVRRANTPDLYSMMKLTRRSFAPATYALANALRRYYSWHTHEMLCTSALFWLMTRNEERALHFFATREEILTARTLALKHITDGQRPSDSLLALFLQNTITRAHQIPDDFQAYEILLAAALTQEVTNPNILKSIKQALRFFGMLESTTDYYLSSDKTKQIKAILESAINICSAPEGFTIDPYSIKLQQPQRLYPELKQTAELSAFDQDLLLLEEPVINIQPSPAIDKLYPELPRTIKTEARSQPIVVPSAPEAEPEELVVSMRPSPVIKTLSPMISITLPSTNKYFQQITPKKPQEKIVTPPSPAPAPAPEIKLSDEKSKIFGMIAAAKQKRGFFSDNASSQADNKNENSEMEKIKQMIVRERDFEKYTPACLSNSDFMFIPRTTKRSEKENVIAMINKQRYGTESDALSQSHISFWTSQSLFQLSTKSASQSTHIVKTGSTEKPSPPVSIKKVKVIAEYSPRK